MEIEKAIEVCKVACKKLQGAYDFQGKPRKNAEPFAFHETYDLECEMREAITYHAEKGKFPAKLFENRSPNQTDEEFNYIKNNYKQYTLPVFTDWTNTIQRCFSDGNWSINYNSENGAVEEENSFKDYVETGIKTFGSIENFIKFVVPSIKSIDANGWICIRPSEIPTEVNSEGKQVISNDLYKPIPYYFKCDQVVDKKESEYLIVLSDEKSWVTVGNSRGRVGYVFEFYNKNEIYKIRQTGKSTDQNFEYELYIKHDLDTLQAQELRGMPLLHKNEIIWQSPFIYATDILDVIATNANWLQASISNCVFPIKAMYGTPCDFSDTENGVNCIEGTLLYQKEQGGERTCHKCKGTGLKNRLSPLGVLLLNPKSRSTDGDSSFNQKPIEFFSPSTDVLKFLVEKIDADFEKAYKNLHLYTSNSSVKGSENGDTALGKGLDLKALYAFIKPISDQIFSLWDFINDCIGKQRYGADFKKPTLIYPKTFDFKTPEDYLNELADAMNKGLPPAMVQLILIRYIDSLYSDNEKTPLVFRLIISADRLFGMTKEDIALKASRGKVAKWEEILHDSALSFIMELERLNPKFFEQDLENQKTQLINEAKKIESELNPVGAELQTQLGGGGLDPIGKVPLALQQLALARERAKTAGDSDLVNRLGIKMDELLKEI